MNGEREQQKQREKGNKEGLCPGNVTTEADSNEDKDEGQVHSFNGTLTTFRGYLSNKTHSVLFSWYLDYSPLEIIRETWAGTSLEKSSEHQAEEYKPNVMKKEETNSELKNELQHRVKSMLRDVPAGSVGKNHLAMQGPWVQSLARELRSHMLQGNSARVLWSPRAPTRESCAIIKTPSATTKTQYNQINK